VHEFDAVIAGLETTVVTPDGDPEFTLVLLHGYAMDRSDLAPFAHSLGLPGQFYFPRAPNRVARSGYAWWPIDINRRAVQLQNGPRDLAGEYPQGRREACAQLTDFLIAIQAQTPQRPLIIGGFSQGGMLACELVLRGNCAPKGLLLFSASRIALEEWQPLKEQMRNLPILASHGLGDTDLAYAAGENLRNWLQSAGGDVTWISFDGGHQIPLVVWRQARGFIRRLTRDHT
jgi:phospholipase/carboxylesterase